MRLKRSGEAGPPQQHPGRITRQRVAECRKRLRKSRATLRALRVEQDEAVVAAGELLALFRAEAVFEGPGEVFDEAGTPAADGTRPLSPEVDRRARLRAR